MNNNLTIYLIDKPDPGDSSWYLERNILNVQDHVSGIMFYYFFVCFILQASAWEETKATLNTLKNKLSFARSSTKPYLSFDEESLYER